MKKNVKKEKDNLNANKKIKSKYNVKRKRKEKDKLNANKKKD